MGFDPPPPSLFIIQMEGGGGSHPKMKLGGKTRYINWTVVSISHYDFRMWCDPLSPSLFVIQKGGGGSHPKMKLGSETRSIGSL